MKKDKEVILEQESDFLEGIKSLSKTSDTVDNTKHLSPKKRRNKAVARARRGRRFLAFIIILFILCAGAYPAYNYFFLPYSAEIHYKNMKNSFGKSDNSLPDNYLEKFGKIYTQNNEIGGWVLVSDTDINYPILTQKKHDHQYFETHLSNGWKNPVGTPYFMSSYRFEGENKNIAIHGNYELFGGLNNYLDIEFYKNASILSVDTLTQEGYYKVFAAFTLNNSEVSNFSRNDFSSEEDFKFFIQSIGQKSVISTPVTVNSDDEVVSLFTHKGSTYTAVFARKIRSDESASVDVDLATKKDPNSPSYKEIYESSSEVSGASSNQNPTIPNVSTDSAPASSDVSSDSQNTNDSLEVSQSDDEPILDYTDE